MRSSLLMPSIFTDFYDDLTEDDLRQSAELVAWVLYRASNEP